MPARQSVWVIESNWGTKRHPDWRLNGDPKRFSAFATKEVAEIAINGSENYRAVEFIRVEDSDASS